MNKHIQLSAEKVPGSIYDVLRRDLVAGRFAAGEKLAMVSSLRVAGRRPGDPGGG